MHTNVETKVAVRNHAQLTPLLRTVRARLTGTLRQVDTYFRVPRGRLKLREINGREFELIYYRRPDTVHSKVSVIHSVPLDRGTFRALHALLLAQYGVWLVVRKRRRLWMWRHTRIHLDTVQRLGSFVELETVLSGIPMAAARREHRALRAQLGIDRLTGIRQSYSDLLNPKKRASHVST
ncbi:MAG: class IV adenylate cyclase [Patescibacteria group bacterium]